MNYHNLRDLKVRSTEDGDNFNVPTYTPTQIFHVPKGRQRWFATVIGSVSATFLVLFTLILVYICLMRVKRSIRQTAELESSLQSLPDESLATAQAQSQLNDSGIRKLSILELEQATSNFSPNNIIGEGPFGSVYKGLLPDGAIAAIKRRLYLLLPNFIDEAERIGRIQHKHLVKLIGYSQSNYQQLLVYDFISNGSVGRHLYDTEGLPTGKLSIRRRLSIALGAAKGLAHLHSIVPTVLHLHFRTSNVLVDENYTPKVSDSGLSNLMTEGHRAESSSSFNDCFLDPEALTSQYTDRSDVYSFGVFLLELVSGREAINRNQPSPQHNVVSQARCILDPEGFIDHTLEHRARSTAVRILELALLCIDSSLNRPSMINVVQQLERIEEKEFGVTHEDSNQEIVPVALGSDLFR
ncbi:unnamed protein product [Rhodiola kirilowii]